MSFVLFQRTPSASRDFLLLLFFFVFLLLLLDPFGGCWILCDRPPLCAFEGTEVPNKVHATTSRPTFLFKLPSSPTFPYVPYTSFAFKSSFGGRPNIIFSGFLMFCPVLPRPVLFILSPIVLFVCPLAPSSCFCAVVSLYDMNSRPIVDLGQLGL